MIELFHPDRMASRILGMGDMLTFIEKAEQQYDEEQARKLEEKLKKNRLTLTDYMEQMDQLQRWATWARLPGCCPVTWASSWMPPTWTKSSWAAPGPSSSP